jgi:hypothetical protein
MSCCRSALVTSAFLSSSVNYLTFLDRSLIYFIELGGSTSTWEISPKWRFAGLDRGKMLWEALWQNPH